MTQSEVTNSQRPKIKNNNEIEIKQKTQVLLKTFQYNLTTSQANIKCKPHQFSASVDLQKLNA